jgi:hypothetical protein
MSWKKNEEYKTIKTYSEVMARYKNINLDITPNF